MLVARLLEEAGLPPGVLHTFCGGADIGEALVLDRNVGMISFTGSTQVGRRVGELAGRSLKRVALELGGNNAFVVLEDADVEAASSAGAWGAFLHQGQICMTAGRHLVHERLFDAYVAALCERAQQLRTGNPALEPDVELGPIINEKQIARVQSIVDDSVAAGASVRVGGERSGPYFPATVITDVAPSMRAYREEIFGPVAPVVAFSDEQEAIELANGVEHGLSAAVHSASPERAMAFAASLRIGMVHVNDQTVNDIAHAPFGGVGASGNGFSFGRIANWDTFTKWQWYTLRERAVTFPF